MINLNWLIGIALAAAQPQPSPAPPPAAPAADGTVVRPESFSLGTAPAHELTKTQAETILSKCDHRRIEASAEGLIDGKMKRRKITVCAAPGDSHAQWMTKLENAVTWVQAQPGLSDDVKAKLVADLRKEMVRPPQAIRPPAAAPVAALPAADALVATVPPMPPPLRSPVVSASALQGAAATSVLLARPPLTIHCISVGERGTGSRCGRLAPDTVFAVRADADLTKPATLRFLRKGRQRADVELAALRDGQIVRFKLPPAVCAGVVRSEVSIQIVAGKPTPGRVAQVTDTLGPFPIHC